MTLTGNTRRTSKGVEIEVDGYTYFMHYNDRESLYDVSTGKKTRICLSWCDEDSPLKKIYNLLKSKIMTIEGTTRRTSEGVEVEVNGYTYFMYYNDRATLYKIAGGEKRKQTFFYLSKDSPIRKIIALLRSETIQNNKGA